MLCVYININVKNLVKENHFLFSQNIHGQNNPVYSSVVTLKQVHYICSQYNIIMADSGASAKVSSSLKNTSITLIKGLTFT